MKLFEPEFPRDLRTLWVGLGLSVVCIAFFLFDVLADVAGSGELSDGPFHLALEIVVVFIAIAAFVYQVRELTRLSSRHLKMSDQIRVASGAFADVLEDLFDRWKLTKAERDVAIFLLKGLSLQDVADMRQSKLGTVKAQGNAIYQKANVNGRHELVAILLDELLSEVDLRQEQG